MTGASAATRVPERDTAEPKVCIRAGSIASMIPETIVQGGQLSGLAVVLLACSSAPPLAPAT